MSIEPLEMSRAGAPIAPLGKQQPAQQPHAFALLWVASSLGALASWVIKLALPLIALHVTHSPALISGVTFAFLAPWLAFGLQAGALVDRLDRRLILLGINAIRLVTLAPLAVTLWLGYTSLPTLYVTAAIIGLTETCSEPAISALTPMIASPERLERANTGLILADQVIEIVGSPLGGLIAAIGLELAVGLGGACYVVAFVALLALRGVYRPRRQSVRRHPLIEMVEGARFMWRQPTLRALALMAGVINASYTAWLAVLPIYMIAPGPLGLNVAQYGLLLMVGGIGGLIGAVLTTRIHRWLGRRWAIGLNILGNTLVFVAPLFSRHPWLVGAAIFVGSAGGPMWTITALSLQQRIAPPELQGRVAAAYRFLSFGAEALGPVMAGGVALALEVPAVFLISGLLTLAMFAPFLLFITERAMKDEI
ncbi:MAG TPA: MFS transporter [Ktedonobacterales bacterium]|nr:MFS transporter [Ktedonobacterales bacterium]